MISLLLTAWLMLVAGAHATAAIRCARRRRQPATFRPVGSGAERALLLRPLAGAEPQLQRALHDTGALDRIAFCVGAEDDPAFPIAVAAARDLCGRGIQAGVLCTGASGPNHKVDQLARALQQCGENWDVLVCCDSDVLLDGIDLPALVARFEDPSLGLLWLAPVAPAGRSFGDRCVQAVLSGSLHAFPLLACIDRDGVVGKFMLVRRRALEDAGGFSALRHHLGEDMELGGRVRAAGHRVERAEGVAPTAARDLRYAEVIDRFARWVAVVRAQRPALLWSYPALFGASVPLGVVTLAFAGVQPWLLAPFIALLVARLLVWREARASAHLDLSWKGLVVDLVLSDLVLLAAFTRALGPAPLRWRGRRLVLGPARRLQG